MVCLQFFVRAHDSINVLLSQKKNERMTAVVERFAFEGMTEERREESWRLAIRTSSAFRESHESADAFEKAPVSKVG